MYIFNARVRAGLLASAALVAASQPAFAEQAASSDSTDDIIVTARRSNETLISVPVQVNVTTGEQMNRLGANDLAKVSENIPFLTITPISSGSGGAVIIRGIGNTTSDVGIQQSVLLNIDNVFVGRGRILSGAMFDVKQVEVLKGPQALFFGKNSSSGVVSVSSNDPGSTLEGYVRAFYEFNARERSIEGAVSVPVSDTFAVRLAGTMNGMDGYIKNVATGYAVNPMQFVAVGGTNNPGYLSAFPVPGAAQGRQPQRDARNVRLTAVWKPTSDFTAKLKYTYSDVQSRTGDNGGTESFCAPGVTKITTYGVTAGTDCNINKVTATSAFPAGMTIDWPYANGGVPYMDLKTHFLSLNMNYETDKVSLSSITGYYKLRYLGSTNTFQTDLGAGYSSQTERTWAFSQEVRAATKLEGMFNLVVGGYYGHSDQTNHSYSYVFQVGQDPVTGRYYNYDRDTHQLDTTFSLLGQVKLQFTDQLNLDAGVRWTSEKVHDINGNFYVNPKNAAFLRPQGSYFDRQRTFHNWSPDVTLSYHPTPNQTLYVSYKTGFKSGGYSDPPVLTPAFTDAQTTFNPEIVKGFEAGVKGRFMDNKLRAEVTVYTYKISGLQVSAFDPVALGFLVSNAGSARQTGFESTVDYSLTPEFSVNAGVGYNDSHYIAFSTAGCYAGQPAGSGVTNAGLSSCRQDLSGRTLPRAPKWSGQVGASYKAPISDTMKIALNANGVYTGEQNIGDALSPATVVKGYWRANASITLASQDDRYELSLIGRNITDAYKPVVAVELARGAPGTFFGYFIRPREVSIQGTFRF